jgi:hypothetical protein
VSRSPEQAERRARTYRAWYSMVRRCTNPTSADWSRYGGRGITVCERWRSFADFLDDMGPCPDGLSLDRINNEGNYEPGNCRWTTFEQQMHNRRSNAGERHVNAKLTFDDVWTIRLLAQDGFTVRSIATAFGVSHANVGYIVREVAWRKRIEEPGHPEQPRRREPSDGMQL